jgi:D-inositol-3-phosphate glycosyltransferase
VDIFTCTSATDTPVFDEPHPNVRIIHLLPSPATSGGSPSTQISTSVGLIRDYCRSDGATYHLVHSHYWLSGAVGQVLSDLWNIPHLCTFHTRALAKQAALAAHHEDDMRLEAEDELLRTCDRLIVSTAKEADELARRATDGSARIRVIPCGVDLQHFSPPVGPGPISLQASAKPAQLLFVGRFDPMKNISLLLDSLACLDDAVHIRFLGGGQTGTAECEALLREARERSVQDRVELYGSVAHEHIPACYRAADAVVVSSLYESFGLVVLEALACGTPVVSTPVGIAPQVIKNGFNGYLEDPGDPARFATAIRRTLELARSCDPAAIRKTVAAFAWVRVARSLLDVYNELENLPRTVEKPAR